MFLLRVSSPGPVDDEEPERDRPVAGPKEPRRSVADTSERRPRVPPEDILREKGEKCSNKVGTLLDLRRTWEGNFLVVDMGNHDLIHQI